MGTKKENAALLLAALGVAIDAEKPEPKAEILQDWADRASEHGDDVKREALTWQLQKTLSIEIESPNLTAAQLQAWLDRASSEPDVVKAEVQEALDPAVVITGPAAETEIGSRFDKAEETFHVKISEAIARHNGTITDPEQPGGHRVIGAVAVEVRSTQVIRTALANGSLVNARD